ncbi:response regulator [Fibrobacterota bacterium]
MAADPKSKIIVIEDQDSIREMMVEFLEVLGYESLEAVDQVSAKATVEQNANDIGVIICDIVLGTANGPDLVKELAKWIPDAVVIYTSGFTTKDLFEKESTSSSLFLPKPFSMESLKSILETAFSMVKTN